MRPPGSARGAKSRPIKVVGSAQRYAIMRGITYSVRRICGTADGFWMKRETRHIPVLIDDVLAALAPTPGKIIVDCTLGLGGHSAAILERIRPNGKLIGIDFDPANIEMARTKLQAII